MACCDTTVKVDYAGNDLAVIEVSVTPDTTTFTANDFFAKLTLPSISSCDGSTFRIIGGQVLEYSGGVGTLQSPALRLHFFSTDFTPPAINAAWAWPSGASLSDFLGVMTCTTGESASIGSGRLIREFDMFSHGAVPLFVAGKTASGSNTIYAGIELTNGPYTWFSSAELVFRFFAVRD